MTELEPQPPPSPRPTFRPHERLRDPADFRRAFDRKRSASDPLVVVYGVENGRDHPRVGISVSKKKARSAVVRNLWKRRIREVFRLEKAGFAPGVDYVIVPRGPDLPYDPLLRSLPGLAHAVARRLGMPAVPRSRS